MGWAEEGINSPREGALLLISSYAQEGFAFLIARLPGKSGKRNHFPVHKVHYAQKSRKYLLLR